MVAGHYLHDENFTVRRDVGEELIGQPGIHHGELIHDDKVSIQIIFQMTGIVVSSHPKWRCMVALGKPVNSFMRRAARPVGAARRIGRLLFS